MSEREMTDNPDQDPIDASAEEVSAEEITEAAESLTFEGDDPLATLRAERDDFEQKYLRVSADYQNYVRRANQNVAAASEQKLMGVARGLVSAMDHFDLALQVDPEKTTAPDLLQGVTSIRDELLKALAGVGIARLDVQPGDEFDPVKHEALMRQPGTEFESGRVVMQMQPGYLVGDKIVRPAQVSVAE
ncbi:MAG: nucleotide exchange factor GrpE [Planctomycetota bacterium]